ncbi:MAG: toll/interleukin-1 receptor domain-containing protein, partial [Actinobacteria bacterium]|nr:toll/interleukin-1 receptor domain-containing protein [Actinomycetota bacterium]
MARTIDKRAWDIFICHASEDKESVARPLASALVARGLRVWLDERELRIGDHLTRRIDDGLARSRYGVVILSRGFFAKEWPRRELDALTTRELADGTVVLLPIWHEIDFADVAQYSLPLANRVALYTTERIEMLADRIAERVQAPSMASDPAWLAMRIAQGGSHAAESAISQAQVLHPNDPSLGWIGRRLAQWGRLLSRSDRLVDVAPT